MKIIDLWIFTAILWMINGVINSIYGNFPAAFASAFIVWMCFLYWQEVKQNDNPPHRRMR